MNRPRPASSLCVIALVLALASCASSPATGAGAPASAPRVAPYLMFQDGRAEEAMRFYVGLFADGRVLRADRYGPGGLGPEGSLVLGVFEIAGQRVMCTDSPARHPFDFTPSASLFVECEDAAKLERLVERLSEGGTVLMPLDSYGFSERFAWIQDRYGVSWQLDLGLKDVLP